MKLAQKNFNKIVDNHFGTEGVVGTDNKIPEHWFGQSFQINVASSINDASCSQH